MITETQTKLEQILLDPQGPKVVALGGGHGLAITLEAAQVYAAEITAVVAVADDGGSSGRITTGLGIPPPGDVRRCLLALTPEPTIWSELFAYRFSGGDIEDHSLGNLLLAALADITGDFSSGVELAGRMLGVVGRVIPAANQAAVLTATVGGKKLRGQARISKARGGVTEYEVGPAELTANPEALQAIAEADQIIIGPGSLYTSVLAVLGVPGVAEAVMASPAPKVFVLNLIGQDGETLGLSGLDHISALAQIGGVKGPGVIVAHEGPLQVPEGREVPIGTIELSDSEALTWSWSIRRAPIADVTATWPEHDPMALGWVLADLFA